MKETTKGSYAALSVIIIITLIVLITGSMCSCTSKSGQLTSTTEKVVIIDSRLSSIDSKYVYKIKRLSNNTTSYTTSYGLYEKGDTILVYSGSIRLN